MTIRRALISVSDKRGVEDFARELHARGVALISTGGTARQLADAGLPVAEVSEVTGFPELMDGRVKTLHPLVHGGLLGRRGTDDEAMAAHAIEPIDLLVVNLYPFEHTVARPDAGYDDAVENIDIGGPAMLRAAAKNHADVTVVVDADDYARVLEEMRANDGATTAHTRFELAAKVFAHTARYDAAIANFLNAMPGPGRPLSERERFPAVYTRQFIRQSTMRYGENPHQAAAFYRETDPSQLQPGAPPTLANARIVQGKELSFNNIVDADTALHCARAFDPARPACVIVKHANPCGVALADTLADAYERAFRADPTSAFGGILAFNRPLDGALARAVLERQFVEVIIAPAVHDEAAQALASKPNVRVLTTGEDADPVTPPALELKGLRGGLLVQEADRDQSAAQELEMVTRRAPTEAELADLKFAWQVARFVKSNAIVYAKDGATVGVGAGQTSRVYSARIARAKAEEEELPLAGASMASDAFFPFRDGIDAAAEAGISAVIQPGGSMRDAEVIEAADEHGMAMVFTRVRHFRH